SARGRAGATLVVRVRHVARVAAERRRPREDPSAAEEHHPVPGGDVHLARRLQCRRQPRGAGRTPHETTLGPVRRSDRARAADGPVSFVVDPVVYPRTYPSSFRYIKDDGNKRLCRTCSFRPWAQTAEVTAVLVHVAHKDGTAEDVAATFSGGRWTVQTSS